MEVLRESRGVKYELFDISALDDVVATIADVFSGREASLLMDKVSIPSRKPDGDLTGC